jgi:hypothetical protein
MTVRTYARQMCSTAIDRAISVEWSEGSIVGLKGSSLVDPFELLGRAIQGRPPLDPRRRSPAEPDDDRNARPASN